MSIDQNPGTFQTDEQTPLYSGDFKFVRFDAKNKDNSVDNLSAGEWTRLIRENITGFKGNAERAGVLMAELHQGIEETIMLHNRGPFKNLSVPPIYFVFSSPPDTPSVAYYSGQGIPDLIGVKLTGLEENSHFDPKELMGTTVGGHLRYLGSTQDLWRGIGWEEGEHVLKKKVDPTSEVASPTLSSDAYLAVTDEYNALRWKIRMARRLHNQDDSRFPWFTRRVMEARFHRATLFRKGQTNLPPLTAESLGIHLTPKSQ